MQKTAPKPVNHLPKSHPVYFLSNKHNKQVIPQGHPDREAMVGHINTLNQNGHAGEARRLYDLHITGAGGAYAKGMNKSHGDDSWNDIAYGDKKLSDKESAAHNELGAKAKDVAYHKTHKVVKSLKNLRDALRKINSLDQH